MSVVEGVCVSWFERSRGRELGFVRGVGMGRVTGLGGFSGGISLGKRRRRDARRAAERAA